MDLSLFAAACQVETTSRFGLNNYGRSLIAMAAPVRQPASSPFTACGGVTSSESDPGELASETAITIIDAQPTMESVIHSERQSLEGKIARRTFDPVLANSDMLDAIRTAPTEVNPADHGLTLPPSSNNNNINNHDPLSTPRPCGDTTTMQVVTVNTSSSLLRWGWDGLSLDCFPNEILTEILGFLDVNDLLSASRVSGRTDTLVCVTSE